MSTRYDIVRGNAWSSEADRERTVDSALARAPSTSSSPVFTGPVSSAPILASSGIVLSSPDLRISERTKKKKVN